MKHSNNIIHFKVTLDYEIDFPPIEFYQKFINLKTLSLYNNGRIRNCFDSRFLFLNCPKLEILQIGRVSQFVLSNIISKTEGSLCILLDLLVRYAPINLEEIELVSNWEITVNDLEKFLKNWAHRENPLEFRIRHVPSITDEHLKILDTYKEKGIIKLFKNMEKS
ncbi:unnamed protein product [Rhizophagus irregularis]|nr:unnamed protein product [Rhizophagus irregularis]